ncbi:Nup133 N terminal like-domain-containing protein [Sporodiniella umbellata]|nr:Nup133 N terminal like-domain-containing protein [Sporodiniella umbellata]
MSANPPGNKASNNELDNLLEAGKLLDKNIAQQLEFPDIADLLAGNEEKLPDFIRSEIDATRSRIFVGILKEVGRAWTSIDNRLYLWDYVTGEDVCEYADQDQLICSVGFVKVKPGSFTSQIEYLLIISTALQIIPIGVSVRQPTQLGEQSVVAMVAVNFAIPTDDTSIRSIIGTADGRVFMVGHPTSDQSNTVGDLANRWGGSTGLINRTQSMINQFLPSPFRVKNDSSVKSICVDNERQLLYILSFNSSIEVINLAHGGYSSIFKHKTVVDHVQQMCRQQQKIFSRDEFTVVSLHVVPKGESKKICLMAMTVGGFRLFFTGHSNSMRLFSTPDTQNNTPTTLELVHVRIPPPEIHLNPDAPRPRYNQTYYSRGTCISTRINEFSDDVCFTVLASAQLEKPPTPTSNNVRFLTNSQPSFVETTAIKSSEYRFATIEEISNGSPLKELSQQLSDPQRRFMVASTSSYCVYTKLRPIDMLERLIRRYHPSDDQCRKAITSFFEDFGVVETCTMCLSIACDSGDTQVADTAVQIFFDFGGMPSASIAENIPSNYLGRANTATGVAHSGKHDGFALYLARILGPIWSLKLFGYSADGKTYVCCSSEASANFATAKQKLTKLKSFMDIHKGFHDLAHVSDSRFQNLDSATVSPYLNEQKSIHELYVLLSQCIDSVEFAVFVLDSYLKNSMRRYMSVDKPSMMKELDIKLMLTSHEGRAFCHELVVTKIDESAVQTPTSESVTTDLQKRCPVFFSQDEYFFFNGIELIRGALGENLEYERRNVLKKSLLEFQKASEKIPVEHLERVCALYQQQSFHMGIVELMLDRARKLDPHQKALAIYENKNEVDEVSRKLFEERSKGYSLILRSLKDAQSLAIPHANLTERAPIADISLYVKKVFEEAFQSKDSLFHYQLYCWYLQENMVDELLKFDTEYMVPFFTRVVKDEYKSLEFLWQYYRNKSQFYKAACCLTRLAELPDANITMENRLTYLAYARINCRCGEQEPDTPNNKITQLSQKLDTLMNQYRSQTRA